MGAKSGTKPGRPLKQNGKGKNQEKQEAPEGPDFSLLRKPVEISVNGLSEVVKVFQNSPPELHHLLSYECDIVYECKVCRNLFRSLANFISHKRVYCIQLHGNTQNNLFKNNKRVNDTTVIVEPECVRTTRSKESWRTSDTAGEGKQVNEPKIRNGQAEPAPFRITVKKDLTSIVEKLMQKSSTQTFTETVSEVGHLSSTSEFYDSVSKELNERRKEAKQNIIHLEPIENTSYGVFQTIVQTSGSSTELIKSQVQDLQRIMSDTEAVLGPDGRVIENGTSQCSSVVHEDKRKKTKVIEGEEYNGPPVTAPESEVELFCNLCKEHFTSYKRLNHHMKSLHMTFRTFYPCPCCKLPLSNSWSVYRHLLKVHRKTNEQIRKLREKVIKRSFKREVLQSGAQKLSKPNVSENPLCPSELIYDNSYKPIPLSEEDTDKQWYGLMEDGLDMQCCGGCGRRFERRAALLAHSQSCLKLLAAKQNVSGPGRSSAQLEKPSSAGRPSHAPKIAVASHSLTGTSAPVRQFSGLPVYPLGHSLHPSQDKQTIPTKKIEIQIRRDYGKSQLTNAEYRTRTPSSSRSEDGAASIGRSDDGTTSGSSETETSGHTEKRRELKKEQDSKLSDSFAALSDVENRRGQRPSFPLHPVQKVSPDSNDPLFKRGVGRFRKHRPEIVHMNGDSDAKSQGNSEFEGSDDSNDKGKSLETSRSTESRKRKAAPDLSAEDESDEDIADATGSSLKNDVPHESNNSIENQNKLSTFSNMKKLQCLTCRKVFKSFGNLRRHVAMHIGWNRFRCIICDFRCFSKCDCISHALSAHLSPLEKDKAIAMVQDLQMDAGGSTDAHSLDEQVDTGDSESISSGPETSSEPLEKVDLQNIVSHENHSLETVGEIVGVA